MKKSFYSIKIETVSDSQMYFLKSVLPIMIKMLGDHYKTANVSIIAEGDTIDKIKSIENEKK